LAVRCKGVRRRNVRAECALYLALSRAVVFQGVPIGTFVPKGGAVVIPTFSDYLAAEVRARRAVLRLTQHDLAQLAGVSDRFVRFVEKGKPSVQLDSLLALLETLGLELQLTTRKRTPARGADSKAEALSGPEVRP
jgi:HTH-type transcriptional regulator / antitoxin HipB